MNWRAKLISWLVIPLLLFGCAPNSDLWGITLGSAPIPTGTFSPLPAETATSTAFPTPLLSFDLASPSGTTQDGPATVTPAPTTPADSIQRVLIVSFDGLRPDAIEKAPMNNLIEFMQSSAYTLNAQTIFPSTTLPSHSSMLLGTCVARHHVIWDEYLPVNGFARGVDLFDLAHAASLRTVMIVGKEKLRQISEPSSTDIFEAYDFTGLKTHEMAEERITPRAVEEIEAGFGLMFVHFPSADLVGHKEGWMSIQQLSTLRKADVFFGELLTALDENELRASTLIIVSSDHGGHDTTHGLDVPEDMTIPWIISGPGIRPMQLTTDVQTMDTAVTVAHALRLPIPSEWQGRLVTEAFGLPVSDDEVVVCH
ncbi:MAG: alkaline phosphatase family protein [Chloroflexota bacterium]